MICSLFIPGRVVPAGCSRLDGRASGRKPGQTEGASLPW